MTTYYNQFIGYLESFTQTKYWKWKCVILLVVMAHLLNPPAYRYVNTEKRGWIHVKDKIENLFAQTASEKHMDGHAANMVYRLTVPAIAKVFHLSPKAILVINVFIGIFILYLIISLTADITKDNVAGLMMGVAAATTYLGTCAFGDFYPLFDQWGYIFLLLAMFVRNPILIFFCATLAAWTDERALLALFYIYFFWKLANNPADNLKLSSFFKFDKYSIAVIAAVAGYTVLRLFLKHHFALVHKMFDVPLYIMMNLPCQRLATWSYFEGMWLIVIVAAIVLFKNYKTNLFFITLVLGFIGYLLFTYIIGDLTRSGTYMFPLIFVAMYIVLSVASKFEMRLLLFLAGFICLIFPPLLVSCDSISEWLLGQWLVGDLIKFLYYDIWLAMIRG